MEISARLSSKGQVTVPRAVREALSLVEGDSLVFGVEGDHAVLARTPDLLTPRLPTSSSPITRCPAPRSPRPCGRCWASLQSESSTLIRCSGPWRFKACIDLTSPMPT